MAAFFGAKNRRYLYLTQTDSTHHSTKPSPNKQNGPGKSCVSDFSVLSIAVVPAYDVRVLIFGWCCKPRRPSVSPNDTVDLQTSRAWFRMKVRRRWDTGRGERDLGKGGCVGGWIGQLLSRGW